jgi:hypothetical protein
MSYSIRRVDYYYSTVKDQPGEAYKLLSRLADLGIFMHAFTAIPLGPDSTQLALFPDDGSKLVDATRKAGINLDGPHRALLVQGDDELGALVAIHEKLYEAHVNVYASTGVSDGKGAYGYLLYVRPDEYDRAAKSLGV